MAACVLRPGVSLPLRRHARHFALRRQDPSASFILKRRQGPLAATLVKVAGSEVRDSVKVQVGQRHICSSCGSPDRPCQHLLFMLRRVLKVPEDDKEALSGAGLSDAALERILAYEARGGRAGRGPAGAGGPVSGKAARRHASGHARRPLEDGETCPICLDDMTIDQHLTWCKAGCGKSMHGQCVLSLARHAAAGREAVVACPLCRAALGSPAQVEDMLLAARRAGSKRRPKGVHPHTKCSACGTSPLYGCRYRCAQCPTEAPVDLCARCFHKGKHAHHTFACSSAPPRRAQAGGISASWAPATRQAEQEAAAAQARQALLALQGRDLQAADYDLLLQLDGYGATPPEVSLPEFLVQRCLGEVAGRVACALCSREGGGMRALPCGHAAHASCLAGSVMASNACGQCGCAVFPGLVPRRRTPRAEPARATTAPMEATVPSTAPLSIGGRAVLGGGVRERASRGRPGRGRVKGRLGHAPAAPLPAQEGALSGLLLTTALPPPS